MAENARQRYLFDEFTLDPSRAALLRNGAQVSLRPKAFDTLLYLVERHGRVVEKEELMQALWPRVVVTDDSLTKCIKEARNALGDASRRYIRTVSRRGYLFDGPVSRQTVPDPGTAERPADSVPVAPVARAMTDGAGVTEPTGRTSETNARGAPRESRWHGLRAMALGIVAVAAVVAIGASRWLDRDASSQAHALPKSVAVLPLENLSPDPDNAYFAAGVHDSILNELAQIGDVNTIARTSMLRYAATTKPISQIARELHVETVMEGSVRYANGRVRVTAQLIDPETGVHLWSEEYDRPLADIFEIQTDIASRIATSLRAELTVQEQLRLGRPARIAPEAYELYLKGRYHWDKTAAEDLYKSIEYYQQAVRRQPDFALAYAGIADAYTILHGLGVAPPGELMAPATAAVDRALAIDPELAEAYVSRALIKHFFVWDFAGGDEDFRRALALNPNLAIAHHLYGKDLIVSQRFDDSVTELKRALELDPYSAAINKDLGETFYYSRRYAEAIGQFQRTLELDPGSLPALFWLARSYEALGDQDKAIEYQLRRGVGGTLDTAAARSIDLTDLGDVYQQSGWQAFWVAWSAALETLREAQYVEPYKLAEAYVHVGDLDRAFEWLEQSLSSGSSWTPTLIVDPLFDPLRDDPRFGDLLRRAGLDAYLTPGA